MERIFLSSDRNRDKLGGEVFHFHFDVGNISQLIGTAEDQVPGDDERRVWIPGDTGNRHRIVAQNRPLADIQFLTWPADIQQPMKIEGRHPGVERALEGGVTGAFVFIFHLKIRAKGELPERQKSVRMKSGWCREAADLVLRLALKLSQQPNNR